MKPIGSIWTDEQWQAIEEYGNNIIVSAGAGSGKTAVLTERVIYKLKQGININSLIVLTFTNAAAKEMKDRIRTSIKQYDNLKEQLELIEQADITTFDAYSLSLVKKYHYLLNLKKDIQIIDNVFLKIKKKEILDKIFLDLYENKEFVNFIDTFSNKDDEILKNKIDEINNKISGLYDKETFYNKCLNTNIDTYIKEYINIIEETLDTIKSLLDEILSNINDETLTEYFIDIKNNLNVDNNYDSYKLLENYTFKRYPSSKSINELDNEIAKQYFTKIKEFFDEFKSLISYDNIDKIKEELLISRNYVKIIIDILKKYNEEIFKFKVNYNAFEFNDILFLSIKLLTENKDILDKIKYETNEIMVDEYQDTNDNNAYFLSLISNKNLYMVGDVKQSIYKFRNANSKIFTNTYYDYKNGNGITIDLNKNFRSRKEVLENINIIFERIMDYYIGGVDYDESQVLKFGNKSYQENEINHNMEILNYDYEKYDREFSKDELEIFIIADDIKEKLESNYQVFDIKKKIFRSATYSDFVILLDRKSNFDLYKKIFEYKGIPLMIHKDEAFSYNNIIFTLKNILKLINSFYLKEYSNINHSLVSVLRSYIFEYSDEDILANIDNLLNCEKFMDVIDKIRYLAEFYKNNTLTELIKEIYKTFDLYINIIKTNDIKNSHIKLDYLIDLAKNLEKLGYDLNDLVNYFDTMFETNLDISFSTQKSSGNAVNIMTIHKSKGLEFPICYFASLHKKFNIRDVKDSFLFDTNYGIVTPVFDEGIKDTIMKKLVKKNYSKEDIEEKIRLLYVALTRAKEKIIMVTDLNKETLSLPTDKIVNNLERLNYQSFNDMLISIKKILIPYLKNIEAFPNKDYELIKENNYKENLEQVNIKYQYKNIDIKVEQINNMHFSTAYDVSNNEVLEIGNKVHEVLEYLDFKNFKEDINNYEISDYLKSKILNLFNMPFMSKIDKYYKEFEFTYNNTLGIIDLLIECDDKFIIVDYKTKEINKDSYINQVKKYMNYIKSKTDKKIEGYIYSIINSEYIKIDEI